MKNKVMFVIKIIQGTHADMGNSFSKSLPKEFNGGKTVLSIHGAGTTEYPYEYTNKP